MLRLPSVVLVLAFVAIGLVGPILWSHDPNDFVATQFLPPSLDHPMGTDNLGRDSMAGMIAGARATLVVVVLAVSTSTIVGVAVGAVAGYRGGWVDNLLSRLVEFVQVIPRLLIAIVFVAIAGPSIFNLAIVIGSLTWPALARLTRAEFMAQRELEYVHAAIAAGAAPRTIVVGQILPNVAPTIVAQVALEVGRAILLAAGLGFLGLSDPSVVTWGGMLHDAQSYMRSAWWMYVFPGAAILLTVWSFTSLGRSLTSALDPRG